MDPITKLTKGYLAFREGRFREQRNTYEQLVDQGQKPSVALIACSDSRVDPSQVLQADPGDLFIVRNVANLVPPHEGSGTYHGTSAALEFAVQHLMVEHLIVLGHAHCGGIRSLFDAGFEDMSAKEEAAKEDDSYHFVRPWMGLVRSAYLRVEGTMPEASVEEKAHVCEKAAVLVSLENLMTFPCIRKKVRDGKLRLHGWYIDIRACQLSIYDPAHQLFESID